MACNQRTGFSKNANGDINTTTITATITGAINGVATKLAVGINQVPASLARALQAIADKDKDQEAA